MEIDPQTLRVTLADPAPGLRPPTSGSFFWPFTNQTGDYTIDHFDGEAAQRIRYNAYWVRSTGVLLYRDKYQELLSGSFGKVYAHTTFFYGNEGAHAIVFRVRGGSNRISHEPPHLVEQPPEDGPLQLSAITLVRVFATPPGFVIVTGEYWPDGQLDDVLLDGAKDGNWIHWNDLDKLDKTLGAPVIRMDDYLRYQKRFGFPAPFPLSKYLKTGAPVWQSADRPCITTVVNLHYDRNRWVRQDSFDATGNRNTRILTYKVTPQDRALLQVDNSLNFRYDVVRR